MNERPSLRANPFCDPRVPPTWAQLTRLAGDRCSLRLQELRRRLARWEEVREDVHFFGENHGWALRYRLKERTLFIVRVLPADLEAEVNLEPAEQAALLKSRRLPRNVRTLLQAGGEQIDVLQKQMPLRSAADLNALLQLIEARIRALA